MERLKVSAYPVMVEDKNGDYVAYETARAEIERLTKERDEAIVAIEQLKSTYIKSLDRALVERFHAEKAESERDEARAQVAAAYEAAVKTCSLAATNYLGKGSDTDLGSRSRAVGDVAMRIRALTPDDAKSALEAYGREKVREGMKQMLIRLRHEGQINTSLTYADAIEWVEAILAAMEKEV